MVDSIKINDLKDEKASNGIYKNIFSKIWNIYAYYNGMGDLMFVPSGFIIEKKNIFPYQLNILTYGKPGLGKNSFINIVLKEKRVKEGDGLSITNDIVRYSHAELELYNVQLKEAKKNTSHSMVYKI